MGRRKERKAPPPLLDKFLHELSAFLGEGAAQVRTELEISLEKRLVDTGKKQQRSKQVNAVAEISGAYMDKVQKAFEKNFDKFELYVRRNIVAVPPAVADDVAKLQRARDSLGKDGAAQLDMDDPSLSREEQQERRAAAQIEALHKHIRKLAEDNQRLELERQALDERAQRFRDVTSKVDFLEQAPREAIVPLKRAVEHMSTLRESFEHMDGIQRAIEDDTRQFKRAKLASRASFRNLHKRFTARTSAMSFNSADDLKALHAKLLQL